MKDVTNGGAVIKLMPLGKVRVARFLVAWEGVRLRPYRDSAELWTVGVGHRIPTSKADGEWTATSVAAALREDIGKARRRVPFDRDELPPPCFDALTCLAFNVGELSDATLVRLVHEWLEGHRDLHEVVAEWVSWDHVTYEGQKRECHGLLRRRMAEACMFVDGFPGVNYGPGDDGSNAGVKSDPV